MPFASSTRRTAASLCVLAAIAAADLTVGACAAVGMDISAAYNAGEAETFVQESIDRGYRILNNKDLSANERQTQFREFLGAITDTKRVARFTLGNYARTASESDMAGFLAAYDEFAAAMYQGYFDWYTDQTVRVANSVARSQDDVVVYAEIISPNAGPKYKIGFRVRKDDAQKNIVIDLQFEGVWVALNQRTEFTSYLQQHGGDFAALTTELKKRTQRFREAWAPPSHR